MLHQRLRTLLFAPRTRTPCSLAVAVLMGLLPIACGDTDDRGDDIADVLFDVSDAGDTEGSEADGRDTASSDVAADADESEISQDATGDASHEVRDGGDDADGAQTDTAGDATADATDDVPRDVADDADSGEDDAAEDASDADVSADWPLPGFGAISGDCNQLDDELLSALPSVFSNRIDFAADPFDDGVDNAFLTSDGRALLAAGNAGGSSLYSELFALETLVRCEGAVLLETETTIEYDAEGSITDFLVSIDDLNIGVSVVRAFRFPPEAEYTVEQAAAVMTGKLTGILESSANVNEAFAWEKQILHVVAYSERHADSVRAALMTLSDDVLADTIVIITTTDGDDAPLY